MVASTKSPIGRPGAINGATVAAIAQRASCAQKAGKSTAKWRGPHNVPLDKNIRARPWAERVLSPAQGDPLALLAAARLRAFVQVHVRMQRPRFAQLVRRLRRLDMA